MANAKRSLPGRLGRLGLRLGATVALVLTFVASAFFGLLFHIDLPAGRRLTATTLTALLNRTFEGRFEVGGVERVGAHGLLVRDVSVWDPAGALVLKVNGLQARVELLPFARAILFGGDKITLTIDHVRIERAEHHHLAGDDGVPSIADAFAIPEKPERPSRGGPGRHVRVWFPTIEIGRGYARGRPTPSMPTLEADVANVRASLLVSPRGVAIDVTRFGLKARGVGGADAQGIGTLHIRAPGALWGSFDGYFGDVQVDTVVRLDGEKLDIRASAPRAAPEAVRALFPEWPLHQDASARLRATGSLPVLALSLDAKVGAGKLEARGPLDLSATPRLDLEIEGRNVDLRAVAPDLPETSIDADLNLGLAFAEQGIRGTVHGETKPSDVGNVMVPGTNLTGTFDATGFTARADVHEPGMPLSLNLKVPLEGPLEFEAVTSRFRLEQAPRLRQYLAARGQAKVSILGRIDGTRVDASARGALSGLEMQGVSLGSGTLEARVTGSISALDRLSIDAKLDGQRLAGQGFSFEGVQASARGPIAAPTIAASLTDRFGPNVEARGRLSTNGGARVDRLDVVVRRHGAEVRGGARRLDISPERVEIEGLTMSGSGGTLQASVSIAKGRVRVHADGDRVDLDALSRILGLPRGLLGGTLNVNAHVDASGSRQQGTLELALGNASIGPVSGIALRLRAGVDGEHVTGDLSGLVRDTGAIGATWDTTIDGSLLDRATWLRALGSVHTELSGLNLEQLGVMLPSSLGITKTVGYAYGKLDIERSNAEGAPTVGLALQTAGLELTRKAAGDIAPLELTSDLHLQTRFDGPSGELNLAMLLGSNDGRLAALSGTIRLDPGELLAARTPLDAQLLRAPLDAMLSVDQRRLSALPEALRPEDVDGSLSGRIAVSGTLNAPTLSASVAVEGLRQTSSRLATAVNVTGTGLYEHSTGRFRANAEVLQGAQRVSLLAAQGMTRGADPHEKGTWKGGGTLLLEGLPLDVFGPLADADVQGKVYGSITLQQSGELPLVAADVQVRGTQVGRVSLGEGKLNLRSDGRLANATVIFTDADGELKARALAGLTGTELVPALDPERPLELSIDAKDYDAAILAPVLSDVLSEVSGNVNAELRATLRAVPDPEEQGAHTWSGEVLGKASLRGGRLRLATLGMQLSDVSFDATAEKSARGTALRVRDLSARSRSDKPNIAGSANLFLEGFVLKSGTADLALDSVPILVEGVSQAHATGRAEVVLLREQERMLITVDVPELEAKLPRATSRTAISLDDNRSIHIRQPLSEPVAPRSGERPLPFILTFDLGRNVRVTRQDLNLPVRGSPQLRFGEEFDVTGEILLRPGGRAELVGKSFVIESGTLRFDTGDPSNPRVDVTASWRAPDATVVYVDVRGTFKQATLSLRSEPPIADPTQLQALLLGGTSTDGEGSTQSAGIGIGADLLGSLLADTPLGAVELRTASEATGGSTTAYSTYTAAVRLSDEVWFEGSYKRGEAALEGHENAFSGTVDWRFRRNWSLRTEIGQLGTRLDVLWRYRY